MLQWQDFDENATLLHFYHLDVFYLLKTLLPFEFLKFYLFKKPGVFSAQFYKSVPWQFWINCNIIPDNTRNTTFF